MCLPEPGAYRVDTSRSVAKVYTYKVANLVSKVAHDLVLSTRQLSATVEVRETDAQVEADVMLWDLAVDEGILSRLEKAECERIVRKKIIGSQARALASCRGTAERRDETWTLRGTLSLMGSRPVTVAWPFTLTPMEGGFAVQLRAALLQTDYGITPYKAMMGMLKLQDRIEVEIDAIFVGA